jgi:hypothetical protein
MQLTSNLNLKKPESTDNVNIDDLNDNVDILDAEVTKLASTTEAGRMSAADKVKLNGIASGAQVNTVTSVAGKTGAVNLVKADVGLANVDNVQQAPITHVGTGGIAHAAATTAAAGFMSAADKTKLDGIATGANAYVHPSGDGNQHVPATGTGNNGKVLKSGATAGSAAWSTLTKSDISDFPSSLPANGGNADTVDGYHANYENTGNTIVSRNESGEIKASRVIVTSDNAPFIITSTTMVANLNAELLDGFHSTDFGKNTTWSAVNNFDNARESGFHRVELPVNKPTGASGTNRYLVMSATNNAGYLSTENARQLILDQGSTKIWTRALMNDGGWGSFIEVPTASGAVVTNLNADMVDGYHADALMTPFDTTSGTGAAYTVTYAASYGNVKTSGKVIRIRTHAASVGSPTLNVNATLASPIVNADGSAAKLASGGIYTLAWDGNTSAFMLQGKGGDVDFLTDRAGLTWTARTQPFTGTWQSVTCGLVNNMTTPRFVALSLTSAGTGYNVISSDDGGITWTQRGLNVFNQVANLLLTQVIYGNGMFLVCGSINDTGYIWSSPDAITWTLRFSGAVAVGAMGYGNGMFVALANSNYLTSTNGTSWTTRTMPTPLYTKSIVYAKNKFVVVGVTLGSPYKLKIGNSSDGITWTFSDGPAEIADSISLDPHIDYGNGMFFATVASGTYRAMKSTDGVTWTTVLNLPDNSRAFRGVVYGDGVFLLIAANDIFITVDGSEFKSVPIPMTNAAGGGTHGYGRFVIIGEKGTDRISTSGSFEY